MIIVGAGVAGLALAPLLDQRGFQVRLFEKRPAPRKAASMGARSINLTLTPRGLATLDRLGLGTRVLAISQYLPSRMVHRRDGTVVCHPYGREEEGIWALRRESLIHLLLERAEARPRTQIQFGARCLGVDRDRAEATFRVAMQEHRDPRFREDPESFNPHRFMNQGATSAPKGSDFPFGGGVHRCLAERYALVEAPLILAAIACRHDILGAEEGRITAVPRIALMPSRSPSIVLRRIAA